MDYHPHIAIDDFEEMRDHYKDYLRSKNYSDGAIDYYLTDFDVARAEEDYDWIINRMERIGVILEG